MYPAAIVLCNGDHFFLTLGTRDAGDRKHRDDGASRLQWAGSCQGPTQELKLKLHEKKEIMDPSQLVGLGPL